MKKRTAFNLEARTLERLDHVPKIYIPNRSVLVDMLLNEYLDSMVLDKETGNLVIRRCKRIEMECEKMEEPDEKYRV